MKTVINGKVYLTIIRNGEEITLTDNEMYEVWRIKQNEYDRDYTEDVLERYLEEDFEPEALKKIFADDEFMKAVTAHFTKYIDDRESGDYEWDCISDAFDKAKEETGRKL